MAPIRSSIEVTGTADLPLAAAARSPIRRSARIAARRPALIRTVHTRRRPVIHLVLRRPQVSISPAEERDSSIGSSPPVEIKIEPGEESPASTPAPQWQPEEQTPPPPAPEWQPGEPTIGADLEQAMGREPWSWTSLVGLLLYAIEDLDERSRRGQMDRETFFDERNCLCRQIDSLRAEHGWYTGL